MTTLQSEAGAAAAETLFGTRYFELVEPDRYHVLYEAARVLREAYRGG